MKTHLVVGQAIRKRSFLLFEVLISLALITLCLFPLLKPHAAMRKIDRQYLEHIQLENLSQKAYCAIKAILYANKQYNWTHLNSKISGRLSEEFDIINGRETVKSYQCDYTIEPRDSTKKTSFNKTGMALDVTLNFSSHGQEEHLFSRTIYLEREGV